MNDTVHFVVKCREIVMDSARHEEYTRSMNESFINEVDSAVVIIE